MRSTTRKSVPLFTAGETFFVILSLFWGLLVYINFLDIILSWKGLGLYSIGTLYSWPQVSMFKDLLFEYALISSMVLSITSVFKKLEEFGSGGLIMHLTFIGPLIGLACMVIGCVIGIIQGWFQDLGPFGGYSIYLILSCIIGLIIGLVISLFLGLPCED